jgi:hypothetical protein
MSDTLTAADKKTSKWLDHIKATRTADMSYKQAMVAASKTYTKNPNSKPKKTQTDESKMKSKIKKLKKKMNALDEAKAEV